MEVITLPVEPRTATGSRKVAQLRNEGRVPAIVYGGGRDPLNIEVDRQIVDRELRKHHRVFNLTMGGKEQPVYMQEVQFDVLDDAPLHLDFMRIDLQKPLQIDVEIVFLGHPKGVSRGGALVKDRTHLHLNVMPEFVPHTVELSVANVDLEDRIVAGDIQLPRGCSLNMPADASICHMPAP